MVGGEELEDGLKSVGKLVLVVFMVLLGGVGLLLVFGLSRAKSKQTLSLLLACLRRLTPELLLRLE